MNLPPVEKADKKGFQKIVSMVAQDNYTDALLQSVFKKSLLPQPAAFITVLSPCGRDEMKFQPQSDAGQGEDLFFFLKTVISQAGDDCEAERVKGKKMEQSQAVLPPGYPHQKGLPLL
jgi:hypothetical protein